MKKRQVIDVTPISGNSLLKSESQAERPKKRSEVRISGEIVQEPMSLAKSIINTLGSGKEIERLSFESNPDVNNRYAGLYRVKPRGIPDALAKKLMVQDDLVASIVRVRESQAYAFGDFCKDRFSNGFVLEAHKGVIEKMTPEAKEEFERRRAAAMQTLLTCGSNEQTAEEDRLSFGEYLQLSMRNAIGFGKIATEVIWVKDAKTSERKFHSFRPTDAGTIFKAVPQQTQAESIRKQAKSLLESMKNKKLVPEKFMKDEYKWIQVIEAKPIQAFTGDEMLVSNFYPVADVEMDGYPVSPMDSAMSAITTHINIVSHNKIYFQTGRAARGMLVFKSNDVDEQVLERIKQQFNASINGVGNSWRVPVFSVGPEDDIAWESIDSTSRDGEFQYLTDQNARVVFAAFAISPDEVPGWSYLSRGTSNQALCLAFSSKVSVPKGTLSISNILGSQESVETKIWTGRKWTRARVFRTGEKKVACTVVSNGSRIETSPDHRFRTVDSKGQLEWKCQKNLQVGDTIVINKKPVPGLVSNIPSYQGKPLTAEMMEVLGWLTGDGNLSTRLHPNTGNVKQIALSWYYHHEKEIDIWERHNKVLEEFGLSPKHVRKTISTEDAQKTAEKYGFETTSKVRLSNRLYDTSFGQWLYSLGFQPSKAGKVIPGFVHTLPEGHRAAFLRGMFSADGTMQSRSRSTKIGARIVIHDHNLRSQTRDLLLGLGIRTQFHEGKLKQKIINAERSMVPGSSTLSIRDKVLFFERIGFLQKHKQPNPEDLASSKQVWDKVPASVAKNLLVGLGSFPNVSRAYLFGCARTFLHRVLAETGRECPAWVDDYYFEKVTEVQTTDRTEPMADVEVFDDEHAFVANGIVVHNSEGDNEYRLEAARDVGIRPLLTKFEHFINQRILPLIDKNLAGLCRFKLVGLDALNAEKESTRLQQDAPLHLTMDEILSQVEKKTIGKEFGGQFLLNPQFQAILDKYWTVGQIKAHFFGDEKALKDPRWDYVRDSFYFQNVQLQMQAQQADAEQQAQEQQAQAQAQGQAPDAGGGQPAAPGDQGQPPAQQEAMPQDQPAPEGESGDQDLSRTIDQAIEALTKSEADLPLSKRILLAQHRRTLQHFQLGLEKDLRDANKEILDIVEQHRPPSTKKQKR